ncbi:hypothetical protein A0H81_12926 [Grifola frondosa]|uniref:PROCN domain-containing protein n=1 Tax=Grifola frondosa TaxID=5627 RepID=A0A1C7LSV3_GRIFR|nr:hypothetical protein A0H81_12926 [Grifola frondosa]
MVPTNDFELPDEIPPFLEEKFLENNPTEDAIALFWVPDPYTRRSGRMRRAQDISLAVICQNLNYLHLDYNVNFEASQTLTTKECKQSRSEMHSICVAKFSA